MIHPYKTNGGADEDFLDAGDPSASHLPPARIIQVQKARVRVAITRALPGQQWDVIHRLDVLTLATKTAAIRAATKAARQTNKPGAMWYVHPTPAFRATM